MGTMCGLTDKCGRASQRPGPPTIIAFPVTDLAWRYNDTHATHGATVTNHLTTSIDSAANDSAANDSAANDSAASTDNGADDSVHPLDVDYNHPVNARHGGRIAEAWKTSRATFVASLIFLSGIALQLGIAVVRGGSQFPTASSTVEDRIAKLMMLIGGLIFLLTFNARGRKDNADSDADANTNSESVSSQGGLPIETSVTPSSPGPPGQSPPGQLPPGQSPPGQLPPGLPPPGQSPLRQSPPGLPPPGQSPSTVKTIGRWMFENLLIWLGINALALAVVLSHSPMVVYVVGGYAVGVALAISVGSAIARTGVVRAYAIGLASSILITVMMVTIVGDEFTGGMSGNRFNRRAGMFLSPRMLGYLVVFAVHSAIVLATALTTAVAARFALTATDPSIAPPVRPPQTTRP